MEQSENQITIRGSLLSLPQPSHLNHGIPFWSFQLEVPRLSGTTDMVPVIAPEPLLEALDPTAGDMIFAQGQIRSHNVLSADRRHLQIFLFAGELQAEEGPPMNEVHVKGNLCRDPVLRRTPLGRDICDLMLAVPRAYHRADYLPCILWGSTAQEAAGLSCRDPIEIWGRLQSRTYTKQLGDRAETRTAYEISAMTARIREAEG